jgi:hypothetical protein
MMMRHFVEEGKTPPTNSEQLPVVELWMLG